MQLTCKVYGGSMMPLIQSCFQLFHRLSEDGGTEKTRNHVQLFLGPLNPFSSRLISVQTIDWLQGGCAGWLSPAPLFWPYHHISLWGVAI
ncbi:hypothetical protein V2G26_015595 [Clonostachys chloroleuca]